MVWVALALHGSNGLLSTLCVRDYLLGDNKKRFCDVDATSLPHVRTAHVLLHRKVNQLSHVMIESVISCMCTVLPLIIRTVKNNYKYGS